MVNAGLVDCVMFAQQAERKIPEPTRTIVLMALLGIVLVGMMLIVATMLGAHWVRRLGRVRRGPIVPKDVFVSRSQAEREPPIVNPRASTAETYTGEEHNGSDDTIVS